MDIWTEYRAGCRCLHYQCYERTYEYAVMRLQAAWENLYRSLGKEVIRLVKKWQS
jgi:hypothetical protein